MQTENQAPRSPMSPTAPATSEPKHRRKIWKILGMILLCVIIFAILFVGWGFYLLNKSQPDVSHAQQITMDNQKDNTSPEDYITMQAESSDYRAFADKVVADLVKGSTKYLNDNLSPNLVASNSQEAVDSSFLPAAKKLFANFDHLGKAVTIRPSTDSYGNSGYSFTMTAVYKDKTEKDFKIYVVSEAGKLVVGNITD